MSAASYMMEVAGPLNQQHAVGGRGNFIQYTPKREGAISGGRKTRRSRKRGGRKTRSSKRRGGGCPCREGGKNTPSIFGGKKRSGSRRRRGGSCPAASASILGGTSNRAKPSIGGAPHIDINGTITLQQ